MPRLLRWTCWKSGPCRSPPMPLPVSISSGASILMTLAPQSASCRTQVGPERTRVRSSTVKRASGSILRSSSVCRLITGPGPGTNGPKPGGDPMDELLYETRDGIGFVTLNRPQARNALTFPMYERLREIALGAAEDPGLRAIVITGAG